MVGSCDGDGIGNSLTVKILKTKENDMLGQQNMLSFLIVHFQKMVQEFYGLPYVLFRYIPPSRF